MEVVLAVLELGNADAHRLTSLSGLLFDRVELTAQFGGLFNLLDQLLGLRRELVEQRLSLTLDVRHQVCTDFRRTELSLRLSLERRLLHSYGDRPDNAFTDIIAIKTLLRELVQRLREAFLEGGKVRSTLCRVLSVNEGIIFLRKTIRMRKHELQRLGPEMERRVYLLELSLIRDEILEPLLRTNALPVEHYGQTGIQVGVHLQATHHMLFAEPVVLEDRRIRQEAHIRTIALVRILELSALLGFQHALRECRFRKLAFTYGTDVKVVRKAVHSLCTDTVHTHGELERIRIELATRVELRNAVHHLAERDSSSVVAD